MKIVLKFTYDADIIDIPNFFLPNLKKSSIQFNKWLYNKDNDHGYWIKKNGKKVAVSFRGDAYVDFLNNKMLNSCNEKAKIIETEITEFDVTLPILYF